MPVAARPLSGTARVLLGMIAEGHTTGYSIKAEIDRSTRLFWGASVGGIYPELRRLAGSGLIEGRDDPRGGATRHCYALTEAGRSPHGGMHEERAAAIQARLARGDFDDPLHRLAVDCGLDFHRCARDWCARTERHLAHRRSRSTRSR